MPRVPAGSSVQRKAEIGFREAGEQSVVEHGLGTAYALFGRLADEDEGAVPLVFQCCQGSRSAHPAGHVHVMTAGMHDGDFVAGVIIGLNFAGEWQQSELAHGQRIHVGTDQDSLPRAVFQHGHHAPATDLFGHIQAQLAHLRGHSQAGILFVKRQLRAGVQFTI